MSRPLTDLGSATLAQGEQVRAEELFEDGLDLFWEIGDLRGVAECLEGMAARSGLQSEARRAVLLFSAATALRAASQSPLRPADEHYDDILAAARHAVGDGPFKMTWAEGQAMPLEQVIAYALERD